MFLFYIKKEEVSKVYVVIVLCKQKLQTTTKLISKINSRSLPWPQMGNGVHFVFFIDFVLLKGAESKTID